MILQPPIEHRTLGDNALLQFKSVRKLFNDVVAVNSLDLTVRRGEFLTFLGPSGSGKTTVLMMLAGFETADHGEILLAGRRAEPYSTASPRYWNGLPANALLP